jgi:uncharacterized protein YndB with AHSA1/START domain
MILEERHVSELVLTNSIDIEGPPSAVWRTLTDPALTKEYMFGCEALSDWKAGSPLLWKGAADGQTYVKGNILEIEPEKVLRHTVIDPNNPQIDDIPENYLTVTYELTQQGSRTTLTVTSGDYATVAGGQARYDDSLGNWTTVLTKLKEVAELEAARSAAGGA